VNTKDNLNISDPMQSQSFGWEQPRRASRPSGSRAIANIETRRHPHQTATRIARRAPRSASLPVAWGCCCSDYLLLMRRFFITVNTVNFGVPTIFLPSHTAAETKAAAPVRRQPASGIIALLARR